MSHYECSECGEFMGFCGCASKRVIERQPQSEPVLSEPERWRKGFEAKYFIPSHIKFDLDDCVYKTKYEGELFDKLAIQTNNMYSIWVDACRFASGK